ncbi:hypothetical protein [Chelativorans sp. YIM 93263]|uniref:hypothetical protein n=1 Tax=Chelativorans sp. YIM 93263 TaxID=2906648 RepID=UPI00237828CE|nr:hypothetical protein [Chelativorans sp. YIM 93263]
MKFSMQLTLDGLVRAMRIKAHEVAEIVESGTWEAEHIGPRREALRKGSPRRKGETDDRRDP